VEACVENSYRDIVLNQKAHYSRFVREVLGESVSKEHVGFADYLIRIKYRIIEKIQVARGVQAGAGKPNLLWLLDTAARWIYINTGFLKIKTIFKT
jgi:hypothetical protein